MSFRLIETVTDESRVKEKAGCVATGAKVEAAFCGEATTALVPYPLDDRDQCNAPVDVDKEGTHSGSKIVDRFQGVLKELKSDDEDSAGNRFLAAFARL
jgi:hypothetical protein